jgi:hypothetical protein
MALSRLTTVGASQTKRSPRSGLGVIAHAAERERTGDRLEGFGGDGNADHSPLV